MIMEGSVEVGDVVRESSVRIKMYSCQKKGNFLSRRVLPKSSKKQTLTFRFLPVCLSWGLHILFEICHKWMIRPGTRRFFFSLSRNTLIAEP